MYTRRVSLVLAFLAVAAAVLLCWSLLLPRSSTAAADANFKGKILFISIETDSIALEDSRYDKLGNRGFLVGKAVDGGGAAGKFHGGRTMWVSLDRIITMTEFDNKEALRKAIQEDSRNPPAAPREPLTPPKQP
jgi:hypothetical protein